MAGLSPVWLLDVDGVINASRPGWNAVPWKGYAYDRATEYKIRWAPQLIARIYELHRAGLVEIRWCSTWCAYADQLERLFASRRFAGRSTTTCVASPRRSRSSPRSGRSSPNGDR
ncbi:hypothetical protein [Micromonospora sp. NPDC005652]|uniref:hypothetical protein n=1 Tax=Micromonospora sp. NPDC005652 TaxID=3157046 RepID=UPI0033CC82CF